MAIGKYSCVKHYAEGELVYSPGDKSNEFFVIVEITPQPALPGSSIVCCRGDVFGETSAFTPIAARSNSPCLRVAQRPMK